MSFYGAAEIKVHAGDKLAWTRNQKGEDRLNNDRVKVLGIEDGKAQLQYESGRLEAVDLSRRHFLDQALVITTNKSQGMSKHRNIVSVDSGKQQEALYVDVTRAVSDLVIFCADKDKLYEQAERSGTNKIASSLVTDSSEIEARIKEFFPESLEPAKDAPRREKSPAPAHSISSEPEQEHGPDHGHGIGDDDGPSW